MADGVGEVNWEGVKYYNALIDGLLERGRFNFTYLLHHTMLDLSHIYPILQEKLIFQTKYLYVLKVRCRSELELQLNVWSMSKN